MPAEIRSISGGASQKIEANIASITPAKMSVPQSRWVRMASIRSSISGVVSLPPTTPSSSRSIAA